MSDVSDAKEILPALSTVATTLSTVGTQISQAYTQLRQLDAKGQIQKAFENAPACKKLRGS
jgi:hypothetical protein